MHAAPRELTQGHESGGRGSRQPPSAGSTQKDRVALDPARRLPAAQSGAAKGQNFSYAVGMLAPQRALGQAVPRSRELPLTEDTQSRGVRAVCHSSSKGLAAPGSGEAGAAGRNQTAKQRGGEAQCILTAVSGPDLPCRAAIVRHLS